MKLAENLRSGVLMAILAFAAPLAANATPIGPGASLPPLTLEDQHGKPVSVDAGTKIVVFSADKAGNSIVQETLSPLPADTLSRLKAVYLADISAMPTVIHSSRETSGSMARVAGSIKSHSTVVLVGVSRSSKTPTCFYLANRGIKAANIPAPV